MNTRTVGSVMTRNVVTARPDTSFKDLVATLADERVSALPVIDDEGHVVGIVSEGDLLHRLDLPPDSPHGRLLLRRRRSDAPGGPLADIAAGLMTRPAVTIGSTATVAAAARLMEKHGVKRLPVVDSGRLVGIVSRRDLLSTYLRADDDIRAEIRDDVLQRVLLAEPATADIAVDEGVVTLTGTADRRSTVEVAGRLARAVSGVVDVVNLLGWQYDDSAELKRHYVFDAQVGPIVRWPT
jgi:CBS domain-containing protein